MKLLVDMADVDNLIISAIKTTDLLEDNWNGTQSGVWTKVYEALNLLRANAVQLPEVAKQECYLLRDAADAEYASEQ